MKESEFTQDQDFVAELKSLRNVRRRNPETQITSDDLARERSRDDFVSSIARRVEHMAASGAGVTARDLERYMGRNDLLRINYLERGMRAAAAVCRLRVSDPYGGGGEWGTGFLVGPSLLLTNHHLIPDENAAARTIAEFGYEGDATGTLREGVRFLTNPALAFHTDKVLDFTIVALSPTSAEGVALGTYGFLRLDPKQHKIDEHEFVTIIQHPNGDEKYIAIRENEVLKIGDEHVAAREECVWYASDTAPGSSGSPVFNDAWQVVALHRRAVPESRTTNNGEEWQLITDEWLPKAEAERVRDDRVRWIANEGVRVSKIITSTKGLQQVKTYAQIKDFLDDAEGVRPYAHTTPRESVVTPSAITLEKATKKPKRHVRDITYYDGREGYREAFLGSLVPLPELTAVASEFGDVAPVSGATDDILRYTHFSVVMNATRRLPFFTAVNIDGKRWLNLERGNDKWYYDPRIDEAYQPGDELYSFEPKEYGSKGYFDRGHLVRRLDPVWGSMDTAALADEDTFHWTNCAPQFWQFNQGEHLWQGLENFLLYNTNEEDAKASVFTGPIFRADDEEHREMLIPQYFWKVIVVTDKQGQLYSSAYVVSQKKYATNIPFEKLPVGSYNNFQVRISKIEKDTGLSFAKAVHDAEVYTKSTDKELRSFSDVEHPRR